MRLRIVNVGLVEIFFDYKQTMVLFKEEIALIVAVEILSTVAGGVGAGKVAEVKAFGS